MVKYIIEWAKWEKKKKQQQQTNRKIKQFVQMPVVDWV